MEETKLVSLNTSLLLGCAYSIHFEHHTGQVHFLWKEVFLPSAVLAAPERDQRAVLWLDLARKATDFIAAVRVHEHNRGIVSGAAVIRS
jgi:hypothetical protein